MSRLSVTFLGSGDAFGSGGRLQTCMLVRTATCSFLIDCGTTVLIAMRRFGVEPNAIVHIVNEDCPGAVRGMPAGPAAHCLLRLAVE